MNAASEMSVWLVASAIIIFLNQYSSIDAFSTVYRHSDTGRKLFGGYRIVPKPCMVSSEDKESKPKTGICMFNYECNQRGGEMIGSCIDGFLFGVCCSLPQSLSNIELENDDAQGLGSYTNKLTTPPSKRPIYSYNKATSATQTDSPTPKFSRRPEFTESTSPGYISEIFTASEDPDELISSLMTGSGSTYQQIPTKKKPILEQYLSNNHTSGGFIENQGFLPVHNYPAADTILLNPDGSVLEDDKNPEALFTPPNSHHQFIKPITQPPHFTQNKISYGYVTGSNGQIFTANKYTPIKIESTTNTGIDSTLNAIYKLSSRPNNNNKFTSTITESNSLFPHMTHRPTLTSVYNKLPVSFNKYPKPEATTVSMIYKKTETVPVPSSTVKTHPAYVTSNENMILVQTLYNKNNTRPTTKIPVETTQSTSKASYKPTYFSTKMPLKPTVSSNIELDEKYPSFNYNTYTGISKPPILITHPVGLDDGGQAISHIIGILNNTNPKPEQIESVTRPMDNDGLSTWVSIIGDEKPTKYKYPSSGSTKPGATTTTYIHGPSFSVETNENKPAPTVVVISHDTTGSGYYTKPTKRPISGSTSYITNKFSTKKPIKKPGADDMSSQTQTQKPSSYYQNNVLHTGQENLINFPPVRNPDLNVSGLNQVEKPTIVQTYLPGQNDVVHLPSGITLEVVPDNVDLNTIDPDEDYNDFTTPSLQEDKVQDQVHSFVEKIVNSLAGNFQDLENLLFKNENKTTMTSSNGIQLNNIHIGDETETSNAQIWTTKKPSRPDTDNYETTLTEADTILPTKRPKPTTKRPLTTYLTTASGIITKRPSTAPSSTVPVKKPTAASTVPTKKPSYLTSTPTKRPTSSSSIGTASKRPTTSVTTKRPSSSVATSSVTTTRKPVVTKRPKPTTTTTRRPTTTTTERYSEPTEVVAEDIEAVTTEILQTSAEYSTPDFRRECGVRPLVKKGGRIVGGKGSQFGYYPWQVLVRESTWLGLFTKNKCGGVLITNRYVITAAHCQPGFLASLVAVFGEYDISGELESKRSVAKNVRRVIVHRQYDPATFENDLALLELDSPVTYEEHIVPICMPREGEDYVGRMATVTGWGRLKYGGGVPSVLQEVRVPLIENSVCQEMFQTAGHQKRIISSFLCAGYANGQKDSCEGDSGGPLMVEREDGRWVLLGTVSHGIKCAAPYLPGVYMRTTYYKPWLKSITGVNTT